MDIAQGTEFRASPCPPAPVHTLKKLARYLVPIITMGGGKDKRVSVSASQLDLLNWEARGSVKDPVSKKSK